MQQARAAGQAPGALPPEVRAQLQKDSEMKVRAGLLMAQIAKAEGIKIGDKELEEGMKELAADSGKNIAKVKAEYRDPKKREMLIGMILEDKVLDIIQSKAKIEDS
jgi:trigger factor